jgi:hypothetical protein
MRLLSFAKDGGAHVGAVAPEGIVDFAAALHATNPEFRTATSLLGIIQSGLDIDAIGRTTIDRLRADGQLDEHLVREPKFLPPSIGPAENPVGALNYQEHIDETNPAFFNEPILFEKYASNLVGHEGEIELPPSPSASTRSTSWRLWLDAIAATSARTKHRTTYSATRSATTYPRGTASVSGSRWVNRIPTARSSRHSVRRVRGW